MADLKTLRLVVASPGDVRRERQLLDAVVQELNHGAARNAGFHLDLLRWETDTYPIFHDLGPQGHVHERLRIDECDLLIGIFWKRFGTPTTDAGSGTESEFNRAYEAWKRQGRPQIMFYFCEKAYSLKTLEEADQLKRVLTFRREFPKEGFHGVYKNPDDFERQVRQHLTQYIADLRKERESAGRWLGASGWENRVSPMDESIFDELRERDRYKRFEMDSFVRDMLEEFPSPDGTDLTPERLYLSFTESRDFTDFLTRVGFEPAFIQDLLAGGSQLWKEYQSLRARI